MDAHREAPDDLLPPVAGGRLLTVADAAAALRVSRASVYRLVHAGELPVVRVGRSFRVPEQGVHDHLRAARVDGS